jgi:hypothetical protein
VTTRTRLLAVAAGGATAAIVGGAVARRSDRDAGGAAPADTSFMRAMHDAFRRDLDRLLDGDLSAWPAFRRQLDIHHRAEDDDLWPRLRGTLDGGLLDEMVAEHSEIPAALDAVDGARRDGRSPAAEIAAVRRLLLAHLDHEETSVLPAIETSWTRAQWREWLFVERSKRTPRESIQFMNWVLDEATPADADAVLRELPAVGRVAFRAIIGPATRRLLT